MSKPTHVKHPEKIKTKAENAIKDKIKYIINKYAIGSNVNYEKQIEGTRKIWELFANESNLIGETIDIIWNKDTKRDPSKFVDKKQRNKKNNKK